MNILHHKSWHVRNKNNIERVRRDEEKAAEEEKEKQRKIALAEQEARTALLRGRARQALPATDTKTECKEITEEEATTEEKKNEVSAFERDSLASNLYTGTGHLNFFKEAEEGGPTAGKNIDHEAEKKKEQEKWEKSVGILTYLGQSATEAQSAPPWYLQPGKRKKEQEEEPKIDVKSKKHRDSLDPLNQMKVYLHKKKHKHKEKEKHKHRHKEKHKEKRSKEKSERKTSSGQKTIDQLRAERLKRETEERKKAESLLAKVRGDKPTEEAVEVSERDRGYNSQYNPEFIRQPKHRHSYDL